MARLSTTSTPSNGSRTMTITHHVHASPLPPPLHRLLPSIDSNSRASSRPGPRVSWREDVVDNEGCGRKSSKICCIYHKPRPFDESSDEDSSSSGSDSDSDNSDIEATHGHGHRHQHHRRSHANMDSPVSGLSSPTPSNLARLVDDSSDSEKDRNTYETTPGRSKKGKPGKGKGKRYH
ncbi:hypothetical protein K435DRAFT_849190 [Dendrothele bispora CBS 962.96]|uniref:Type 1 phosphatases regulator n=1 Tax=Dendrothele bispora (strain CBS 962.96) TaxID=1314807 RepID=A0A4S8MUM8_DENBC|nr:hypothetical protein K435DRAFT_849190 [Dendrothele bispora CBS 962.96]